MSEYYTFELSPHDAAPIELYKFTGPSASYFYTSGDASISFDGDTYAPTAIKRNAIKAGTQDDDGLSLELELPFDAQVVQDYAYSQSPATLLLEVIRLHREGDPMLDYVTLWKGRCTNFSVSDRICKIRVPSVFARSLQGDLPNVYWQNPCNHTLYDQGCKLVRASNLTETTAVLIDDTSITVGDDGYADGQLVAGEMVVTRTGERRMILSNVSNTITVNVPFADILEDDEVELVRGCDHSYAICVSKFSNGINYGGHKDVPGDNPFVGTIG